mmetsp:Transcript_927/g.1444  ORF Transcript_927/g.1444 Transcript_927/m.1444 type:complete len:115 (-) Transcript_927:1865-2209(-)
MHSRSSTKRRSGKFRNSSSKVSDIYLTTPLMPQKLSPIYNSHLRKRSLQLPSAGRNSSLPKTDETEDRYLEEDPYYKRQPKVKVPSLNEPSHIMFSFVPQNDQISVQPFIPKSS